MAKEDTTATRRSARKRRGSVGRLSSTNSQQASASSSSTIQEQEVPTSPEAEHTTVRTVSRTSYRGAPPRSAGTYQPTVRGDYEKALVDEQANASTSSDVEKAAAAAESLSAKKQTPVEVSYQQQSRGVAAALDARGLSTDFNTSHDELSTPTLKKPYRSSTSRQDTTPPKDTSIQASSSQASPARTKRESTARAAAPNHNEASGSKRRATTASSTSPAKESKNKAPAQRSRRARLIRVVSTLLIIAGVGLLIVAGAMWGTAQWRYHEQAVINDRLAQYAEVSDNPDQAPQVDWEGLKAINDEVVAWLQIPGTTINYPVYQGSDNVRYLRHNAEGDWTVGGQLFIDYECTAPGLVDEQTIVYGHHLDDGSMFEQVAALDDQAAFDATGTVWYVTEQEAYELEPLLMYFTQAEDTNARHFQFANVQEFREYLGDLLTRSVTRRADAAQIIAGTTHVLTLSTCNYYDGYGRSLLVCVPKAEAREALAAASVSTTNTESTTTE